MDDAGASTDDGAAIQVFAFNGTAAQTGPGTARTAHSARSASVWTSLAARPPAERRFSSGIATAQALRNGAGDNRPELVNPQSGRCLNVAGGSVADGVRLQISDCDDTAGQVWGLP